MGASKKLSREDGKRAGERVRFAVVGQGHFAQAAVLPAFANTKKRAQLVALFSDDATKLKKLKKAYDVEHALPYDEYDAFLASGAVDAVYIALPNDLHRDFAVRAARAGVHVLCEKPMATTVADCEQMIAACRDGRVKLMIAYRLHLEAGNLEAVEMVKGGRIGDPRYFSAMFSMQVTEGNIRTKRERGGGPLYDIGVYCINAARYIFQAEPVDVVASTARRTDDPRFKEIEEQVSAVLRFPDERLATFTAGFGAADLGTYTVVGTKGSLTMEPAFEYAEPLHLRVKIGEKTKEKKFKKRDQLAAELVYFSDCIAEDRDPEPSGTEGLIDVRIIEAIHEAARTGQRVAIKAPARRRRPSAAQEIRRPPHGKPDVVNAEAPHPE